MKTKGLTIALFGALATAVGLSAFAPSASANERWTDRSASFFIPPQEKPIEAESLIGSFLQRYKVRSSSLTGEDRFARTMDVLRHFGVPEESVDDNYWKTIDAQQSMAGINARLPYLDLNGLFSQYSSFDDRTKIFSVFQDGQSKNILDYSVSLGLQTGAAIQPYRQRLLDAARNKSLKGLKIAIDPGHMGTDYWDKITGKMARDKKGRKVSEGVINTQVALLLAKEFEAQGAEVILTRATLGSVSQLPYEKFDLRPYALYQLRESVNEDWFQQTLANNAPGAAMYAAFEKNPKFKEIFSERMRNKYFVVMEDLNARIAIIDRFQPDITVIIHFDTYDPPGQDGGINPKPYNATKVYVPGAFTSQEVSSREDHAYMGYHLLTPGVWEDSVKMATSIVNSLSQRLGIPLDKGGGSDSTKRVAPGVYTRNLVMTRKVRSGILTFAECMFYNDAREFEALLRPDFTMDIGGKKFPYSSRLVEVAEGLRNGVIKFVRDYQ